MLNGWCWCCPQSDSETGMLDLFVNQLLSHCSLQPRWLRRTDLTLVCPNTVGSKPSREGGPDSIGEKQHQLCVIPLPGSYPQQGQWMRQASKAKCCLGKSVLFPTAMCWHRLTICQLRKQLPVLRFVVSGSSTSGRSFRYPAGCCHSFADTAVWAGLGCDPDWGLIYLGAFWEEGAWSFTSRIDSVSSPGSWHDPRLCCDS